MLPVTAEVPLLVGVNVSLPVCVCVRVGLRLVVAVIDVLEEVLHVDVDEDEGVVPRLSEAVGVEDMEKVVEGVLEVDALPVEDTDSVPVPVRDEDVVVV